MIIVNSINTVPIRITDERWRHITHRHPEMYNQLDKVSLTLSNPDMILEGDTKELLAIRLFPQTPLTRKYLVAAYRESSQNDGFILTAYFASQPSQRRTILWKR
ncbi:MAG: hypothetical protein AB1656_21995 [Candidatus Omnitrophota bacterium]